MSMPCVGEHMQVMYSQVCQMLSLIFLDFVHLESKIQGAPFKYTQFQCV
jgi:hypothetical protein